MKKDNDEAVPKEQDGLHGVPMRNHDGSVMLNDEGSVVYRSQYLSTHPLRTDCKQRAGYGGKKLTYVSGDGVIRTMNAAFGHGGWGTEVTMERQVQCEKDSSGRWVVGFVASVRITLRSGVSHEDCGSGDGINESKIRAYEKAIKSAVTDAMKRAARHFGERLGNALYVKGNGVKTAPIDNRTALRELERKEGIAFFGDQKKLLRVTDGEPSSSQTASVSPKQIVHIHSKPTPLPAPTQTAEGASHAHAVAVTPGPASVAGRPAAARPTPSTAAAASRMLAPSVAAATPSPSVTTRPAPSIPVPAPAPAHAPAPPTGSTKAYTQATAPSNPYSQSSQQTPRIRPSPNPNNKAVPASARIAAGAKTTGQTTASTNPYSQSIQPTTRTRSVLNPNNNTPAPHVAVKMPPTPNPYGQSPSSQPTARSNPTPQQQGEFFTVPITPQPQIPQGPQTTSQTTGGKRDAGSNLSQVYGGFKKFKSSAANPYLNPYRSSQPKR